VRRLRELNRNLVLQRLAQLAPARLTLDFDGSVLGTTRMAEGTAVGYNKKKKGHYASHRVMALMRCNFLRRQQMLIQVGFPRLSGRFLIHPPPETAA
jgi:hypothetical protein